MKIFKDIREFFWPLLDRVKVTEPKLLSGTDIYSVDLEKTLEYAIKNYEEENDRIKIIEGKSSIFIGILGVIISVILGVTTILINSKDLKSYVVLLVIILFIITIYLSRTLWFSIKALERRNYNVISISNFISKDEGDNYYRNLIANISNKIRKNSITINAKVNCMTMAQEYFKRAIGAVVFYSFIILTSLFIDTKENIINFCKRIIVEINNLNLSGVNVVVLYLISITAIVISIISFSRKKS